MALTKKDLLEAIEDMPEDMEVYLCSAAMYRGVEDVNVKKLWLDGKRKEVITLHPYPVVYSC